MIKDARRQQHQRQYEGGLGTSGSQTRRGFQRQLIWDQPGRQEAALDIINRLLSVEETDEGGSWRSSTLPAVTVLPHVVPQQEGRIMRTTRFCQATDNTLGDRGANGGGAKIRPRLIQIIDDVLDLVDDEDEFDF